jgi:toxin ParE1/3/4
MARAAWSDEAINDLEEIAYYIGIHDGRPATAERIVNEVHQLANLIASQPHMGTARPEFGETCRVFSFEKRWVILFRPSDDGVDILRFVDGRRDYDRLF